MNLPIETRVANGVAFLDEKIPGWYKKINLDKLRQNSTSYCVVSQLYDNNYLFGLKKLELTDEYNSQEKYGFQKYDNDVDGVYVILTDVWRKAIQAKLDADKNQDVEYQVVVNDKVVNSFYNKNEARICAILEYRKDISYEIDSSGLVYSGGAVNKKVQVKETQSGLSFNELKADKWYKIIDSSENILVTKAYYDECVIKDSDGKIMVIKSSSNLEYYRDKKYCKNPVCNV